MTKSKIISIVLVLVLVLSLSYGCSKGGEVKTPEQTKPANETVEPTSNVEEVEKVEDSIVNPEGVFPIVKEQVEITLAVPQSPNVEDYYTNYYTRWLEEKTGIKLNFVTIPTAEISQKVQLMLASGVDLPDAFSGVGQVDGSVFTTTNIVRYASEGLVIPLNEYIDKYGENIRDFLKLETAGMTYRQIMTSADGKIYYMPGLAFSTVNRAASKMWINKQWLDTLGLEIPKTTQEFKEVLQAFATRDPNQNGVADEIPLVGTTQNDTYNVYDYLIGSFIANNVQFHRLLVNDGIVSFAAVTDEWREAMMYINDLTSNGLLSSLTFTQDHNSLKQMVNDNNNIVGAYTSLGVQGVAMANNPEILSRYVGIAPLEGPNGVRHGVLSVPIPSANGVITSACEHPEVVFRLFDFMLSEEASTLSRFGIEDEHWVVPEEGALTNYGTQATIKIINNIWNIPQNTMWQNYNPYINRNGDGQERNENPNDPVRKNCEAAIQYSRCEPQNVIPTLTYSPDEIDEVNEIITNIDEYVQTMIAKFAVGEMNPYNDSDWSKYLREFEVLGLDRFIEISQRAYIRMNY